MRYLLTCDTGHETIPLGSFDSSDDAMTELNKTADTPFIVVTNARAKTVRFYPMAMVRHFDIREVGE